MKILIVCHYFPPHVGGIEYVAQNQAKYLTKHGHDVTVLTSAIGAPKGKQKHPDGYMVYRVVANNSLEKAGVPFPIFSPRLFSRAFKLIKEADVVHTHDVFYLSSWVATFWSTILSKKLFITQHVALVNHPSFVVMKIQNIIYGTIGKMSFKKASKIIVYNANVENYLLKLKVSQRKIFHTRNGIDTNFFSPVTADAKTQLRKKYSLPLSKPVILFVGRLVPKKGFDIVYDSHSDQYFTLIVGNGVIPKRMDQDQSVSFFGSATQQQLRDLYRLSDVFVFPAIGEIFTLVMQEAMACGLPIITTDDTGYLDYEIRHHLIGFTNRKTDAIKSKIFQVLKNDNLRKEMSDYSRELSLERFSWEKNYSKEFSLYNQVAAKS